MHPFDVDPALRIGTVFEVTGNAIKAALTPGIDELSRLHRGRIYSIGIIGSLLKIHVGRRLLFGMIRTLRLQTEEETSAIPSLQTERRVLEADLIGEGAWNSELGALHFVRGMSTSALPMQEVHLLTDEETMHVYGSVERAEEDESECRVVIGQYVGPRAVECRANIDKMFGQHCSVLGSTGAGKSSAVAAVLQSVLVHRMADRTMHPRIVLIDPHGEYGRAFGDRCCIFRAYNPLGRADDEDGEELRLPYWLMTSDEFRSLVVGKTEFEATSQANTVYKALAHARMVAAGLIEPAQQNIANTPPDYHPQDAIACPGVQEHAISSFDRDKPTPFSLTEFRKHIEWRQPYKHGNNAKVPASEFHKDYGSILDKLNVLSNDSRISFLMKDHEEGDPGLEHVLSQFVSSRDDERDIRIIDISGLPNEVAGPLTAAVARLLFQYKLYQSTEERKRDPILVVCEEAHRYVPNRGEAQYAAAQDGIRRLAREGRKYGIGLMLVSQRPSDVEETVLSQCNTWLVLRLTNSADQNHVSRMLPDTLGAMTSLLSSLPRQEALFLGEGAAIPARIRLRTLEDSRVPKSADVLFGSGWADDPLDGGTLRTIAARMSGLEGG